MTYLAPGMAGACNPNFLLLVQTKKNRRPRKWCAGFILVVKATFDSLYAIEKSCLGLIKHSAASLEFINAALAMKIL